MKVKMYMGEEYPVFGVGNDHPKAPEIEVPYEMIAEWNAVKEHWEKCQKQMSHFYYSSYPEIYTQYKGNLLE